LIVIPLPLISVLFERGKFLHSDAQATALAVAVYGIGLPSFVLQKVMQPLFYAREDTRTPFKYAVNSMIVNAVLAIGLTPFFGFLAAAIGTTVAGWAMMLQLWFGSRQMGRAVHLDQRLIERTGRIGLASIIMGFVLLALAWVMQDMLQPGGHRYLGLLILVGVGMASYFATAQLLGAFRIGDIRASVRRGQR
jgi:putative peptidoglycan lipid II flippase